jgi:hypothetical protein
MTLPVAGVVEDVVEVANGSDAASGTLAGRNAAERCGVLWRSPGRPPGAF